MKRDDDYIRELLLEVEAMEEPYLIAPLTLNASPDDMKKHQHAELLCDAGLFALVNKGVYRMTNQGHDYIAAIRSDTIWVKTKDTANQLGGVTLGIMKDLAISYIKKEAAEKFGIVLS